MQEPITRFIITFDIIVVISRKPSVNYLRVRIRSIIGIYLLKD